MVPDCVVRPDTDPPTRAGLDHPVAEAYRVADPGSRDDRFARACYFACVDFLDDVVGEFLALAGRDGLWTLSVEGSDVLLNGDPIELRGVSLHEEAEGRGRSLTRADREERFAWLADLGCNFARLAHYPHHPGMARRADEAGVLLWAEVPAYWSVAFGEPEVRANYRHSVASPSTR